MRTFEAFEKKINEKLHKKYKSDKMIYNKYIIENILFNEKSHLVSNFKEYLIIDDEYEFLKKLYNINESSKRLKFYTEYYQKYNYIFPNYIGLPESQYLYHNINSKQKIIDEQHKDKLFKNSNKEEKNISKDKIKNSNNDCDINKSNKIFNSKVYDSIFKSANKSCFSQFSLEKNNEKLNSIDCIKRLISEINIEPFEMNKNIKLNNSPFHLHLINNNNNFDLYEKIQGNKKNDKNYNNYNYNKNYCCNKFQNNNLNNLFFNNQNISNNSNNIKNFFPLYTKVNIKQKASSKTSTFNNINPQKQNINNNNYEIYNTIRNSFIYRKLSPLKKLDRLSFSIKRKIYKKESSRTTVNYPLNNTSSFNLKKKLTLKTDLFPNENILNINNYSAKNKKIKYLNNLSILKNKLLYTKKRANSKINYNIEYNTFST